MCGPGLWSGHWIPASGLLKAEWTLNTVCSLQPHSSEEISQQLRQSRGADHSQRSKKSPGSYPPQAKKTTPLMMCLSCLWFQPVQKQIKSHRNQEQHDNQWQFLAGFTSKCLSKTSTVGLQREALNNTIKKRDLKKTWLQFFFFFLQTNLRDLQAGDWQSRSIQVQGRQELSSRSQRKNNRRGQS